MTVSPAPQSTEFKALTNQPFKSLTIPPKSSATIEDLYDIIDDLIKKLQIAK